MRRILHLTVVKSCRWIEKTHFIYVAIVETIAILNSLFLRLVLHQLINASPGRPSNFRLERLELIMDVGLRVSVTTVSIPASCDLILRWIAKE